MNLYAYEIFSPIINFSLLQKWLQLTHSYTCILFILEKEQTIASLRINSSIELLNSSLEIRFTHLYLKQQQDWHIERKKMG